MYAYYVANGESRWWPTLTLHIIIFLKVSELSSGHFVACDVIFNPSSVSIGLMV